MTSFRPRTILRNVVPGLALPGLIYLVSAHFVPTLQALAIASTVPLLDTIVRLARGKTPSVVSLAFVGATVGSIGLAFWLRSPLVILLKGAAISAIVGIAFASSAVARRPLTRTLALHLTTDHREERHRLAERWRHPVAVRVFQVLSIGWGLWMLVVAGQQTLMALTISPGTVVALEPGVHAFVTAVGVAASIAYVRRRQQLHPEIGMLPVRSS